jgi:ankyrin repeat protein
MMQSPLQIAARYGHVEVAKALITAGADINRVSPCYKQVL